MTFPDFGRSPDKIPTLLLWLLNGVGLAAILGTFWVGQWFAEPVDFMNRIGPVCSFKQVTHWPCPTCGLTRAFILIAQGEWMQATRYHLLALPVYWGIVAFSILSLVRPVQAKIVLLQLLRPKGLLLLAGMIFLAWGMKLAGDPTYW